MTQMNLAFYCLVTYYRSVSTGTILVVLNCRRDLILLHELKTRHLP
jgi:hypothetical protein